MPLLPPDYRPNNSPSRKENYSPTLEELTSPEVMRRAAEIAREIRRREAPRMEALLNAGRLTEEDYQIRINV